MYADRHLSSPRFSPASLGVAVGINAAVVAALMLAAPHVAPPKPEVVTRTFDVPLDQPPPPEPQPRAERPTVDEKLVVPLPPIPLPANPAEPLDTTTTVTPPAGPLIGTADGPITIVPPLPPVPLPPLVEASVDPRYAADLQPMYPPAERRAGKEGSVTIRVLIGVDGRVKEAQRVAATSDAFWRATLDRATSRWRFRPATRGSVPVEGWRTMTLRFVLRDDG